MRNIEQALKEHKQRVLDAGYDEKQIMGIFLYGSQNYEVQTENSDVDTKCVIIPTVRELMFEPIKPTELKLYNDEHCEVMDIIHLIKNFTKQNINFIEILFTDYCWINPLYKDLWEECFTSIAEDIAHYNPRKCFQSICGQAIHTLKQNKKDGKKVANGIRLQHFLVKYLKNKPYKECIKPEGQIKERIMTFKNQKELKTDMVAENLISWFEEVQSLSTVLEDFSNKKSNYVLAKMEDGALRMVYCYDMMTFIDFLKK